MPFTPVTDADLAPAAPASTFAPINEADLAVEGQQQYSPSETVALNATDLFGAGPAILGGISSVMRGGSYAEWRDAYKRALEQANEENPRAKYVGKGLGLGAETVLGGALGKVVGGVSKAVGIAPKIAGAVEKITNPTTQKVVEGLGTGLLGGAAYGAAGGAGKALSEGKEDIAGEALEGAGTGAVLGGGLGAVFGGIAGKFAKAPETQLEDIVRSASERALPRKQSALADLVSDAAGNPANRSTLTAKDVLIDNLDPLKKLRSKDHDVFQSGIDALDEKISSLNTAKPEAYKLADTALGGGVDAKTPVEMLKNKAASERNPAFRKVLEKKADDLEQYYSSINTNQAKDALINRIPQGDQTVRDSLEQLAASLPDGQKWTKATFLDHLAGGNAEKDWSKIDPGLRQEVEQLPWSFDPTYKIPLQSLRRDLTISQDEAATALGTLNWTANAQLKSLSKNVLDTVLNREMDRAAELGGEAVKKAIQEIRDVNLQQSVLLKINEAAATKADKLKLAKPTLGATVAHGGANLLSGYELLGAGKHLLHGDIAGAGIDLAGALAAKYAPKVAVGANRGATDALAALKRAADSGDTKARRALLAIQAAARMAKASVSQSTVGSVQSEGVE